MRARVARPQAATGTGRRDDRAEQCSWSRTHPISAEMHLHGLLEHDLCVLSVPDPGAVSSQGHSILVDAGHGVAGFGVELTLESDDTLFSSRTGQKRTSELQPPARAHTCTGMADLGANGDSIVCPSTALTNGKGPTAGSSRGNHVAHDRNLTALQVNAYALAR